MDRPPQDDRRAPAQPEHGTPVRGDRGGRERPVGRGRQGQQRPRRGGVAAGEAHRRLRRGAQVQDRDGARLQPGRVGLPPVPVGHHDAGATAGDGEGRRRAVRADHPAQHAAAAEVLHPAAGRRDGHDPPARGPRGVRAQHRRDPVGGRGRRHVAAAVVDHDQRPGPRRRRGRHADDQHRRHARREPRRRPFSRPCCRSRRPQLHVIGHPLLGRRPTRSSVPSSTRPDRTGRVGRTGSAGRVTPDPPPPAAGRPRRCPSRP